MTDLLTYEEIYKKHGDRGNEIFDVLCEHFISAGDKNSLYHKYQVMTPIYYFASAYLIAEAVDDLLTLPIVESVELNLSEEYDSGEMYWSMDTIVVCVADGDRFNIHSWGDDFDCSDGPVDFNEDNPDYSDYFNKFIYLNKAYSDLSNDNMKSNKDFLVSSFSKENSAKMFLKANYPKMFSVLEKYILNKEIKNNNPTLAQSKKHKI